MQWIVNRLDRISTVSSRKRRRVKLALMRAAVKAITRISDPVVTVRLAGVPLRARLSHDVLFWRLTSPHMNLNFGRLAAYIQAERSGSVIDVGANIGDGLAVLRGSGVKARVLLVEGNEAFLPLLQENAAALGNADAWPRFVGDGQPGKGYVLETFTSSASLRPAAGGSVNGEALGTLDDAVSQSGLSPVALIKTDTDGFDFAVLRGAAETVRRDRPVIFLEWEPFVIQRSGERMEEFLCSMCARGYERAILWDNFGSLLCSSSTADVDLVRQLSLHFYGDATRPFIDMALFHDEDAAVYDRTLRCETAHFTEILREEGVLTGAL